MCCRSCAYSLLCVLHGNTQCTVMILLLGLQAEGIERHIHTQETSALEFANFEVGLRRVSSLELTAHHPQH